jgi:hypothetical protein
MKCHLGKNYLSYGTIEGLPLQQLRTSTYLNNHQPKSAKTDINRQLAYFICSNSIINEFHLELEIKQEGLGGGQKSASFIGSHSHFHLTQHCMIGLCHLMAGDESRMTGDCCWPEGSIHRSVRMHSHLYSHIYMALWLF